VLVVCVLRAPVLWVGSHADAHQNVGKARHIGDPQNKFLAFNLGESVRFKEILTNLNYLWQYLA
jgi:hypothetical protein